MKPCVAVMLVVFTTVAFPTTAASQTITMRSFLDQKEQWPKWAHDKTTLSINGRYEGRVAKQFRLIKFPGLLTPTRVTVLPKGIESGQRMTVSGILRKQGSRYELEVSRIALGRTDYERLTARVEKLGEASPEQWYPIADEYVPIAKFYDDEFLHDQIKRIRLQAFELQRKQAAKDPLRLQKLVEDGAKLGVDPLELQAISFQSLVAMTNSKTPDISRIQQAIRKQLTGWDDHSAQLEVVAEKQFQIDPVATYDKAGESLRKRLHRRFYRSVSVPVLTKQLKPDGSNGLDVANRLQKQFPEESQEIDRMRTAYIDYRLSRVPLLTRKQLEELERLLDQFGRHKEKGPSVDRWLESQEKRLNNGQLDGVSRTADEYFFAFERWKNPKHRDTGVELKKRAWVIANEAAPKEAIIIARDLEKFGWTRLRDKWMTTEQVADLPKDDVALAMREGRVVVGMKSAQIVDTLGQPGRRIRVVSARSVQEIWVYGDEGSSAITVHIERRRRQAPEEAIATLVSRRAE